MHPDEFAQRAFPLRHAAEQRKLAAFDAALVSDDVLHVACIQRDAALAALYLGTPGSAEVMHARKVDALRAEEAAFHAEVEQTRLWAVWEANHVAYRAIANRSVFVPGISNPR